VHQVEMPTNAFLGLGSVQEKLGSNAKLTGESGE